MAEIQEQARLELSAEDPSCATFVLHNEDHTLGNSLRYVLSQNPQVEFCGYSAPHPFDQKIHIRVQTHEGLSAAHAFRQGLNDLTSICDVVLEKLDAAIFEYKVREENETKMSQ
eukprot:TRINITY_DN8877_c0_g3_i1.p1 TRINITY_DN8877_c0_g3~~TRINITY_DN8877_c0_g3_i1.p1  ORF type:complete len:114 (+),score=22.75 TRINITY_DN8877_c0_g3_i1:69-410(+)